MPNNLEPRPPLGQRAGALAQEINRHHELCLAEMSKGVKHAIRAGELLVQAKALCKHGEWGEWLASNCWQLSERTAQAYMRLARHQPELEAKAQRVADLTMGEALALLAAPATDPGVSEPKPAGELEKAKLFEADANAFWARARIKLDGCRAALETATTVPECVAIRDIAQEVYQDAAEIHIRAEWNAGRLLNWMELARGQDDVETMIGWAEVDRMTSPAGAE